MDTDTITLATAVLGVALGAGSLGWQAATYVLSGGRVKVALKVGAIGRGGMALHDADDVTPDSLRQFVDQGFEQMVIAVEVRSVGRLPVTVAKWRIRSDIGLDYIPLADSIGPPLPHRLDVGESETWALDLGIAMHHAQTTIEVLGKGRASTTLTGAVELGDGRTRVAPARFTVAADGTAGVSRRSHEPTGDR